MDGTAWFAAVVVLLSIIFQVWAAGIAFSLVEATERRRAWLLVAVAVLLMAFRRTITLIVFFTNPEEESINVMAEIVALATSALLVFGLRNIGPLFRGIQRSRDELKQQTEQLNAINEDLTAFSYTVSHDLKAPLRHIAGYADILTESATDRLEEKEREHLHSIRSRTQAMTRLIDNMLKLAQTHKLTRRSETVNLSALATAAVEKLREEEPKRQVNVRIQTGIYADGDVDLLNSAIENLLGNAWKFTRTAGEPTIEFGSKDQGSRTVYFVRDNGIGFDPQMAGEIFRPFKRLHATKDYPGSGIGLATVEKIISLHGGRIWAESSPGQGATFFFTLK